jgi:hypothetical protein
MFEEILRREEVGADPEVRHVVIVLCYTDVFVLICGMLVCWGLLEHATFGNVPNRGTFCGARRLALIQRCVILL